MSEAAARIRKFWRDRNVPAVMLASVPAFACIPFGPVVAYAAFAGAFIASPRIARGIVRVGEFLHSRLPERVTRSAGVASNVAQWVLIGGVIVASCISLAGIAAAAYVSIPCLGGTFLLGSYRSAKWIARRADTRKLAARTAGVRQRDSSGSVGQDGGSDVRQHEMRTVQHVRGQHTRPISPRREIVTVHQPRLGMPDRTLDL